MSKQTLASNANGAASAWLAAILCGAVTAVLGAVEQVRTQLVSETVLLIEKPAVLGSLEQTLIALPDGTTVAGNTMIAACWDSRTVDAILVFVPRTGRCGALGTFRPNSIPPLDLQLLSNEVHTDQLPQLFERGSLVLLQPVGSAAFGGLPDALFSDGFESSGA